MNNKNAKDYQLSLNLNVRGLKLSSTLAINEQSNALIAQGKEVVKLGLGQSPFPVPEEVEKALQENAFQKDYLPVKGLYALRKAVSDFNYRTEKIKTDPDDVLVGPGSKELIFLLQLVYYGDLIIPTPSWVSYSPQAKIVDRHVYWMPVSKKNNYCFSAEELEDVCRDDPSRPRIVILNYPANPTGNTYHIDYLKKLAKVARKYRVILVSDEIYGLLHHQNQHVSIARFYPEGTIISNGLSKWCGAGGWRLGVFSFPPDLKWLLNAMAVVASESFTSTCAPVQYAAIKAFEGGPWLDDYLVRTRKVLKTILRFIEERFNRLHITYPKPHGAFYIFPDFEYYRPQLNKAGIYTSVELCERLLSETGVALLPGLDFGMSPEELSVRLSYVDFNGKNALEDITPLLHIHSHKKMENEFLRNNTPKIILALDKLEAWLKDFSQ
jgi:aspartate aminotransferase